MAYEYIKRAYGRDFEPGQRVNFNEYQDGRGTVMEPEGDPQYVRVKFDNGTEGDCHPGSVYHITSEKTVLVFGNEEYELQPPDDVKEGLSELTAIAQETDNLR